MKGEFDNELGSCVSVDKDGDQVFLRFTAAGRLGAVTKGKGTYVGGTGKWAGLTGTVEFTRTVLRPTMQGTSHSFSKTTFTYKLP